MAGKIDMRLRNARALVARGAKFLDERDPGWDERIILSQLELASSYACILGQLHGEYTEGLNRLGIGDEEASGLGFLANYSEEYRWLNQAWSELLEDRMAVLMEKAAEDEDKDKISV